MFTLTESWSDFLSEGFEAATLSLQGLFTAGKFCCSTALTHTENTSGRASRVPWNDGGDVGSVDWPEWTSSVGLESPTHRQPNRCRPVRVGAHRVAPSHLFTRKPPTETGSTRLTRVPGGKSNLLEKICGKPARNSTKNPKITLPRPKFSP